MIGLRLGLMTTTARGVGGPPPAGNPLHTIGGLTRIGAGGRAIAAADGTYGPYTVAGGIMTPNTTPVTPGTYDVGGITITVAANRFDVATVAEFQTVASGAAAQHMRTRAHLPLAQATCQTCKPSKTAPFRRCSGEVDWAGGTYDPAALTITGDAASNSYIGITMALRPKP